MARRFECSHPDMNQLYFLQTNYSIDIIKELYQLLVQFIKTQDAKF